MSAVSGGGAYDSIDGIFIANATARKCRGESGIRRQARIRIHFENPRTVRVDSEVDARVTAELQCSEGRARERFELREQRRVVGAKVERARRVGRASCRERE